MNFIIDNKLTKNKQSIACIGVFDGFHLGHIKVITKTLELAKKYNLNSIFFTFDMPDNLKTNGFIYNNILKKEINIQQWNFNNYYEFDLKNKNNLTMDKLTFLNYLKINFNITKIVVGKDFQFAKNRSGKIEDISDFFGINNVYAIDLVKLQNQEKLSSSYIKNLIINNDFITANNYLLLDYFCKGKVKKGNQYARELGYKTANIYLDYRLVINDGVYVGTTIYNGKTYPSLIYYDYLLNKIESHLINEDIDLYDEIIEIHFINFLEKKELINNKNDAKIKLNRCVLKAVEFFKK